MQVHISHHVDASEPDSDGFYDYHYEYDLLVFQEGATSLVARSYSDNLAEAHFLRAERCSKAHRLTKSEISGTLATEAIAYLRSHGKREINWLSGVGNGLVPVSTSSD